MIDPPEWGDKLRGRRYNRAKKAQGGTGANQYKQKDQNDTSANTADRLAKEHGVSPATKAICDKESAWSIRDLTSCLAKTSPKRHPSSEEKNKHQVACPDRNPRTGGLIPTPTGLTGGHRIKEPARRTALYQGNGQVKIRTSILW